MAESHPVIQRERTYRWLSVPRPRGSSIPFDHRLGERGNSTTELHQPGAGPRPRRIQQAPHWPAGAEHLRCGRNRFLRSADKRTPLDITPAPALAKNRTTCIHSDGVRPSSRTGGEPTIDQGAGPCRSKAMARHRIHSLAFKKQVVQEYAAGATLNALAREHDLSRTLIRV